MGIDNAASRACISEVRPGPPKPAQCFVPRMRLTRATPVGQQGFTLIELLVVIVLIGIIASFAMVSISRNPKDLVLEEAQRLQALLQLASDEAVLQSRELALQFHKDGYRFLRLDTDGENWQWTALDEDQVFRPRCLDDLVKMEVTLEGEGAELESMRCRDGTPGATESDETDNSGFQEAPVYPRVFLLSSGEMTPFEIALKLADTQAQDDVPFYLIGQIHGALKLYYPGEDLDDQS